LELFAWDRTTNSHRQVTNRPEGTRSGHLDPTGTWIWWFDDTQGNEFGRWIAEPFVGGAAHAIAPELPPAYTAGAALGGDFAIVGSSTAEGTSIHFIRANESPSLLYRHREHATVGGLSRDERFVAIGHAEHGDTRHPALRVLDTNGKHIGELWDGAGRGLWVAGWSPVVGDQRLLVRHERRGLSRPLLWNVSTGEVIDLEPALPGELDVSWYPDGLALLLVHDHRGHTELYRYDLRNGEMSQHEIEPGMIVQARVRPDGELWYAWTRASTPLQIRTTQGLLLRPPGEEAPEGVPYTNHTVDGVHVFLAEPPTARPHPTIFRMHGGPASHNSDAFSPLVQAWVDHGFAVILINYRGSTGYGKAWRDAIQGNPGLTELEDIARVHEWVVRDGLADPDRIILAGASWGGYLTLLGLGTQPERWSLGIAAVPVADCIAAYEDEMEPLKGYDRALFGGSPKEIPEAYRLRSPITYVARVRAPVFILAGQNDPRCPIRQIEHYVTRLQALGKPHEVYRYEAGHGSLVIEEAIHQVELQIAYAARHLGTRRPE
jgi:acetyl esterase/lipase